MRTQLCVALVALASGVLHATTIQVPADQPTIQAGIDATVDGDTVLVAPGVYTENIDFNGHSVVLLSAEGSAVTTIQPASPESTTVHMRNGELVGTEIRGFTVSGGGPAYTVRLQNEASATIWYNVFHDNIPVGTQNREVISCSDAVAMITRNLFYNNGGIGCVGLREGSHDTWVVNNTMNGNERGFFSIAGGGYAINNIVTNSLERGIGAIAASDFTLLAYNNVWGNDPNYDTEDISSPYDIHVDPQFSNVNLHDYRLMPESPCIDAGHPDAQYNDPNGTRNDMGVYWDIAGYPFPGELKPGDEDVLHVVSHNPTITWRFLDTLPTQFGYQVEVGTDTDWSVAEMWNSGEVYTADSSVVYAGLELTDGLTYFYRARVNNGVIWGPWQERDFQMNNKPTTPVPLNTVGGPRPHFLAVALLAENADDVDGDSLAYNFELYEDPDLLWLVASFDSVPEQRWETATDTIDGLNTDQTYWWRVQSNDGYEVSTWSVDSFVTRDVPITLNVPADQPTIQAGIESAYDHDTVLVAPGEYGENLILHGRPMVVMSSDGPDATTLSRLWEMDPGVAITDTPDSGTVFSGFTVVDWGAFPESDVVYIDNCASVIISNNVFRENLWGAGSSLEVIACSNGPVIVTRNIFYSNGTYCVGLHEGAQDSWIINNTFDSNKRGFFSVAGGGYAINNIVTNSAYQGIGSNSETDFTLLDYNNVWNNNPNYDIAGLEGEHDIHADPQYWDESVYDYRLRPGSPCVEAGHPDPQYNDPNGSRNDMGALWLVGNYPYPGVPNLGSEDTAHVVNHTPNFFWSYYDTLPQQVAFELEVGTDSEWSTAEMWASGQVYTADTFTAYAGLTLDDGGAYFYRVRVYGGNDWGDWVTRSFRMNSVTASLTPNSPVGGEVMHACDIQLFTENGVDQENDQLYYYFEVYDDPSLTSLVYSADHVRRKTPLSYSGFVSGLGAEQDFWWRVRAFDGFEFCEWSTVEQFSTLPSVGLVNVPTEQATIQAAIELAYHNDTIIVAPGTYTENIDYSRRAIVLLGGGRAEPTTLTPAIVDNPTVRIVGALAPGAELRGFTISGGGGGDHTVRIESSDSTIVRDCVFHDNIPVGGSIRVVVYCRGGTVFVSRNLFYGNGGRGCVGMRDGANESWIINNTMHDNERGFYSIAGGGYAINNIVTNSLEVGVRSTSISDFTMLAYNDIYNNNPNYDIDGVEVPFDIQVDPVYVDAAAHDFGLQSHSPCINAGHPDPQYNDSDGSRNDIGAFQWIACCIGNRGNVDGDSGDQIDISDLVYLVDYMFTGGPVPVCYDEADIDGSGVIDISDLVYLVDFMFTDGPVPVLCP